MAAATAGHARTLVTWNVTDFPASFLGRHGTSVSAPDAYLRSLPDRSPREVLGVLARMAAGKRRPPMTAHDVLAALDRAGVPGFARGAESSLTIVEGGS
ncbi:MULTISPECIES: hypothetical protein [unclassified Nonomuraea]|uniref:hypothetical protein n=1 Tax=unclassified Nonomuraea TaxID=2593643 RepID=UPI0033D8F424